MVQGGNDISLSAYVFVGQDPRMRPHRQDGFLTTIGLWMGNPPNVGTPRPLAGENILENIYYIQYAPAQQSHVL